jgi:hypothetical protein
MIHPAFTTILTYAIMGLCQGLPPAPALAFTFAGIKADYPEFSQALPATGADAKHLMTAANRLATREVCAGLLSDPIVLPTFEYKE